MSSRKITPGEENYVAKTLEELGGAATGDQAVWMDWVLKKKREKIQDRLLVVSRHRIVSIKRNKMGKKAVCFIAALNRRIFFFSSLSLLSFFAFDRAQCALVWTTQ